MFETAVTIAILTVGIAESDQCPRSYLDGLHCLYQVFHLRPVGTDILHGTGSHVTGNQRQVLCAIQLMFHTPVNHIVPNLATAAANTTVIQLLDTPNGRVNHHTFKVAGQQQIAASTYYYIRER